MQTLTDQRVFAFSGFYLDANQCLLYGPDGNLVPLTARVFDTLLYLVEHQGELLSKATLMKAIWPSVIVEENNLNQNISLLRKALGEVPGDHRYIVTVPGRGYRFVPPVQRLSMIPRPAGPNSEAAPTPIDDPGLEARLDIYFGTPSSSAEVSPIVPPLNAPVRFPRFFVCQRVGFMLPIVPDAAS